MLKLTGIYIFLSFLVSFSAAQNSFDSMTNVTSTNPLQLETYDIYNFKLLKARSDKVHGLVKIMENDFEIKNYGLRFVSTELSDKINDEPDIGRNSQQKYKQYYVSFDCDGKFTIKSGWRSNTSTGRHVALVTGGADQGILFLPSPQLTQCSVLISEDGYFTDTSVKLSLISEKNVPQRQVLRELRRSAQMCSEVQSEASTLLQTVLLKSTNQLSAFSCLQPIEISPLSSGHQALKEKVKLLLGQDLPERIYKKQKIDDNVYIDFSKAPHFKAILISTLIFEDDFYGYLIGRLLEHHASEGTPIQLLVSEKTLSVAGRAYINYLVTHYPQMHVQSYKWKMKSSEGQPAQGGIKDSLHRVQHTKFFLAIGEKDEDTKLFIGGRNIGTTYLEPIKSKENKSLYFEDFEAVIQNKDYVVSSARKILALADLDAEKFQMRAVSKVSDASKNLKLDLNLDMAADFMSVPFADGRSLENFYVDLIQAARQTIRISSPYFSPTAKIKQALRAASERGVQIHVLTNTSLNGDTGGSFITDINRMIINEIRQYKNTTIYGFKKPMAIYHGKYLLIDDELSIVGSVNLNQRSFLHDIENITVVSGVNYHKKMMKVWNNFLQSSDQIQEQLPILGISGPLLKLFAEDLD